MVLLVKRSWHTFYSLNRINNSFRANLPRPGLPLNQDMCRDVVVSRTAEATEDAQLQGTENLPNGARTGFQAVVGESGLLGSPFRSA